LKDSPRRFEIVTEIFDALKVVFYNPNRVQEVWDKFQDLQMKQTQKYHAILTTFTLHASEADDLESIQRRHDIFSETLDDHLYHLNCGGAWPRACRPAYFDLDARLAQGN
jgi:hypothetical protein